MFPFLGFGVVMNQFGRYTVYSNSYHVYEDNDEQLMLEPFNYLCVDDSFFCVKDVLIFLAQELVHGPFENIDSFDVYKDGVFIVSVVNGDSLSVDKNNDILLSRNIKDMVRYFRVEFQLLIDEFSIRQLHRMRIPCNSRILERISCWMYNMKISITY